jgi:hypothetical protein
MGGDVQYTPLFAVGGGRGADMSRTGFHPLCDKILSQGLVAVADQGCRLKGSSPLKGTAYRAYCILQGLQRHEHLQELQYQLEMDREGREAGPAPSEYSSAPRQ